MSGDWQTCGPALPIEFSRISDDGRLTLVVDEANGGGAVTLFARSGHTKLNDAIANLKEREKTLKNRIGFINLVSNTESAWSREHHPLACDRIVSWAKENRWDAVIWTALTPNFLQKSKPKSPFSVESAIEHIRALSGTAQIAALEYIDKAPKQIITPFRGKFAELDFSEPQHTR